jgi:tRNA(Ile)-lysidine synthase
LLKDAVALMKNYRMLKRGDRVVVGVSGGADSVSLLHFLCSLREKLDLTICAAHLNHSFRGDEADKDARFVEQLSLNLGVHCHVGKIDVPKYQQDNKISAQLAARKMRYCFFAQVAKEWGAGKVALAHNRDDQAETVLLRLIRGAGLDGLSGIPPVRDDDGFTIIRPFLSVSRQEIEQYCQENKLDFRTDQSNFKTMYLRNKVRLELLPYLKRDFNPRLDVLLAQTAQLLQEERKYLEAETERVFAQIVEEEGLNRVRISLAGFKQQPLAIQRRLFRKAVVFLKGNSQELGSDRLSDLMELMKRGRVGAEGEIKEGLIARKGYDSFILEWKEKDLFAPVSFKYSLALPGTTFIPELSLELKGELLSKDEYLFRKQDVSDNFQAFFDWEKLSFPLMVRNRCSGDRFKPLGMMGSKKIKKLFIDEKVPLEERSYVPLIDSPEGIIWVVGYRQSELGKIEEKTKKILSLKADFL